MNEEDESGSPPDAPAPAERSTDEQEDRDAILARRARFVATALVGLTGLSACDPRPQPCLNISEVPTTPSATAEPMPCLSPVPNPPDQDAGTPQPCLEVATPPATSAEAEASDAGAPADAGASDASGGTPPQPCLSMPMPSTRPQPCLAPPPGNRVPPVPPVPPPGNPPDGKQ